MSHFPPFLGLALMGVVAGEFGLLFLAPRFFAGLAPFGMGLDRRLRVPASRLRNGLPRPGLSLDEDYVANWSADAGSAWVRLKYKWFGFNRSLAIGRVSVEVQADEKPASYRETAHEPTAQVDITVRWLPVPMSVFVIMGVLAVVFLGVNVRISAILTFGIALGGSLQALLGYWRMKPAMSAVVDEIEMAFERPSELGAQPRESRG